MNPQLPIGRPNVLNAPSPSVMYAAGAHYPRVNIRWNMLEEQISTKEQSSKEQSYRLHVKCGRNLNNLQVWSALVANQQDLSQVPSAVACDFFVVASYFKVRFVDALAQWLFTRETSSASPTCMEAVDMWGTSVFTTNNDDLIRNLRYENVLWSLLWRSNSAWDMQVLMQEGTNAVWEQFCKSQIPPALHCTHQVMSSVPIHEPLSFLFLLLLRFLPFVPFFTSWRLFKIVQTDPVVPPCDTASALLLNGKCRICVIERLMTKFTA